MTECSLTLSFVFVALYFLSAVAAFPSFTSEMALPGQCMLSIGFTLNQSNPVNLCAANFSQVTHRDTSWFLVAGEPYRVSMLELEFCIVATDMNCTYSTTNDCIHENIEYRIRVKHALIQGYLHVLDTQIEIVPSFQAASGFNLSKSATDSSHMHITH
ncbi:hypothetical protein BG006_000357, partial [Podila minutissima]